MIPPAALAASYAAADAHGDRAKALAEIADLVRATITLDDVVAALRGAP